MLANPANDDSRLDSTGGFCADLEIAEAALEGDEAACEEIIRMMASPVLRAALIHWGATASEAQDLLDDMTGDCFGGVKPKGGLHRLLEHYNGKCPLPAFFRHVALNRLIGVKRKQVKRPRCEAREDGPDPLDEIPSPSLSAEAGNASLMEFLRGVLHRAFALADAEELLLFRLVHDHRVPQKRVARMWGLTEATLSRQIHATGPKLRGAIMDEARRSDPWLELRWEDFACLCRESADLFGD